MEVNQPVTGEISPVPATSTMMFSSKTPSVTTFVIAVLLFLMPFVDIKCGGMKLQDVKGFELATGFNMKSGESDMPFFDEANTPGADRTITKTITKTDKQQPNLFALVALLLTVAGAGLCFVNNKMATTSAMVAGILSVASLVGLFIDIKNEVKSTLPGKPDDIGGKLTEGLKDLNITVDFTPWYYITVIVLLAGAFLCNKRMQAFK